MKKLKSLDLFSGIGGFKVAQEMVGGFETTQFVENDPYCQKVLKKHWPHIPIHDDIRTFTAEPFQFDAVCGGFPCQDISTAGRGKGITEESRSGLFYELMRVVRMVRPRYVILENVAAILNNGLDIVLGELSEAGYDAEWAVISASSLGACHQRSRWWLVAYPNSNRHEGRCTETRNKTTPRQDSQILGPTNTSELERCNNDGKDKGKSRTDGNLSRSSDGGKTISTETGRICNLSQESNDNKRISNQNNYQENNNRTLVQKGQSRVQLPEHKKLGGDKTTLENNSIRHGDDNSSEQRMDNQESDVANSNSNRLQGKVRSRIYRTTWRTQNIRRLNPSWRQYESKPTIRRGDDGLRNRVDRLKSLGNSVVPQVAAIPLQRVRDIHEQLTSVDR